MQGHQRKFGQSPSQDNLQMLAGYSNGQNYYQNTGSNQRMQTPPPPNASNKMATTIQGTGVKMINNQFSVSMKIPYSGGSSSQSGVTNNSNIKSVEMNKKIRSENESLLEKIKELELKGKQSNFDYTKNHIDVGNYILNNYSKHRELITELSELKNSHLEEVKRNRQIREMNEQMKSRQRGYASLNPQEQQEQNRQVDLNRQIEQIQKENQSFIGQLRQLESEASNTTNIQSQADKTFQSSEEKLQLIEKSTQIQTQISKLTEQLEEQEKRQKENQANSTKKNFFSEYDQMCRQVAQLRQQNQDLNESLKQKIIELCKLQGKEPPNFNQGIMHSQFQN